MTPGAASGITPAMTPDMHRLDKICSHPLWQKCLGEIGRLEADRIFCRHDVQHFLDVARIAYIENLEQKTGIPKEMIYAAALLHDIGRAEELAGGRPHQLAGAELATEILEDCGFSEDCEEIISAILDHRRKEQQTVQTFAQALREADRISRLCFCCRAQDSCNWSAERRNHTITL